MGPVQSDHGLPFTTPSLSAPRPIRSWRLFHYALPLSAPSNQTMASLSLRPPFQRPVQSDHGLSFTTPSLSAPRPIRSWPLFHYALPFSALSNQIMASLSLRPPFQRPVQSDHGPSF